MQQFKILLVLPFFYPHRGGSQKYAEELYAKLVQNHPEITVDVLAYNTDKTVEKETYRGMTIYRVPCWNVVPARFALANPYYLIKKLYQLKSNNYTHVNTHIRFFDATWWLWIYAKLIKAKSIYTGHVATHPVHQNKIVQTIAVLADKTIARFSLKFYDIITFTNKAAQKFFKNNLGVKRQTHIVYGGIDTNYFSPAKDYKNRTIPKLNIKIKDDQIIITFVGRLIWTKGVTYLVEAIEALLQDKKLTENVTFIIGGPGELEDYLEEKIKQAPFKNQVIMTKDLQYEQVRDLLRISDIFINPSHHNEGFPNTILEAGSCGCFVIATDNAGTKEVIESYKTGILINQKSTQDIYNSIKWALENKEQRLKIAKHFRNILVKEFDWQNISEVFYKLLN